MRVSICRAEKPYTARWQLMEIEKSAIENKNTYRIWNNANP